MLKSHEVLKKVIEPIGAKSLASDLKLSTSIVYKWCEDPSKDLNMFQTSGAINPLDRIKQIYDKTKNPELVNWICRMANGYFVQNALIDEPSLDACLFKNTQRLIKEFSRTLEEISESFDSDNRITRKEAEKIRAKWENLKSIGEGFIFACELGKFNKSSHKGKRRA
jgi:hypothetical protein